MKTEDSTADFATRTADATPYKTDFDWSRETDYIGRVTDKDGNVPEMNRDRATFIRYCEMQQACATRDGKHDAAEYIGVCLDDLRRGDE